MNTARIVLAGCFAVLAAVPAAVPGQNTGGTPPRITVPLSDPSKPMALEVSLLSGSIAVTGYDGKDVIVETRARDYDSDDDDDRGRSEAAEERRREREAERRERERERRKERGGSDDGEDTADRSRGLRRIPNLGSGLKVYEESNHVSIEGHFSNRGLDVDIKVPVQCRLELQTVNDGDIVIRNIRGEIEANNTNGRVSLFRVTGPVVAHALNGDVVAEFTALAADRPSSFSSLNGDIDVSLPAAAKASLRIKSDNGEIFTDFDLQLEPRNEMDEPDGNRRGKKRQFNYESAMYGQLNGGGTVLRFQTFNGSVYVRKAK